MTAPTTPSGGGGEPHSLTAQCQNTDRHLWPLVSEEENAPRLFVTVGGGIGIDVGGHVIVKPLRDWHALAIVPAENVAWSEKDDLIEDLTWVRQRVRNCRGAIESGQMTDKDVRGGLLRVMDRLDDIIAVQRAHDSHATLKARIEELETALKPFAKTGWMTSEIEHTARTVVAHMHPESQYEIILSSEDFQRARATLASKGGVK